MWDDEQFIVKNVFTTSWKYLPQIFTTNTIAGAGENSNYYRPLTTLSFLIDRSIWGLQPVGFHLTNTVLHAGAAVLLFLIFRKLKMGKMSACCLSLIFGLHPIQTEAVVYMNSRGDSLFIFFLFAAVLSFLYVLEKKTLHFQFQSYNLSLTPLFFGVATCALFVMSILSKEIGVVGLGLFGLMFLFHVLGKRGKFIQTCIREQRLSCVVMGCSALLFAGYMGLRLTVLNFANTLNFYGSDSVYTTSILVRLATFSRIFVHYLLLLVVPYPLHMERDAPILLSLFNPWTIGVVLLTLGVVVMGVRAYRAHNERAILLGMGWMACAIAPVSGLIPINGLMYEHWLYLPMVGAFLVLFGLVKMGLRMVHWQWKEEVMVGMFLVMMSIYAVLTLRQNWIWRNPISFYTYTLRYAQSARLHNNLAMSYDDVHQYEQASDEYKRALELSNAYPQIHYNYGRTLVALGQMEQAETQFLQALVLDDHFDLARMQLVALYINTQAWEKAKPQAQVLLTRYPEQVDVLLMHGAIAARTKDPTQATIDFQKALILSGSNPQVQQTISQFTQK